MKTIPLTRGLSAKVDDADFTRLSRWKWFALKCKRVHYAARRVYRAGKSRLVLMHRSVIRAPADRRVDHRNGDGLDNRRLNLRTATVSQNGQNRTRKAAGCSSSYKGVSWHRDSGRWQARICVNYLSKYLGLFGSEIDAAKAYDTAAVKLFGEFAAVNFKRSKVS